MMHNFGEDGGPAFPLPDAYHANGQIEYGSCGMTLRDWFAGQVLSATSSSPYMPRDIAREAYMIADAMLEARNG